jgi:hypothetical protein
MIRPARVLTLFLAAALLTTQPGCLWMFWPWNYSTSVSDTLWREREQMRQQRLGGAQQDSDSPSAQTPQPSR